MGIGNDPSKVIEKIMDYMIQIFLKKIIKKTANITEDFIFVYIFRHYLLYLLLILLLKLVNTPDNYFFNIDNVCDQAAFLNNFISFTLSFIYSLFSFEYTELNLFPSFISINIFFVEFDCSLNKSILLVLMYEYPLLYQYPLWF